MAWLWSVYDPDEDVDLLMHSAADAEHISQFRNLELQIVSWEEA